MTTQVRVAIRAAGINFPDILMAAGQYQHVPKPPYTPGLEYSGTVLAVGTDVTDLAVGTRVLNDGFASGPRSSGVYQQYGGFASFAIAPREAVHAIPGEGLDRVLNDLRRLRHQPSAVSEGSVARRLKARA